MKTELARDKQKNAKTRPNRKIRQKQDKETKRQKDKKTKRQKDKNENRNYFVRNEKYCYNLKFIRLH